MKFNTIALSLAFVGALTMGVAHEGDEITSKVDIDTQIEAIKAAPAQKRVELMNEFKQKLAAMNQEQRMAAITQMQEKMHRRVHNAEHQFASMGRQEVGNAKDHQGINAHMQERAQEMIQEHQMQTSEQMTYMQRMNQTHVGDQINHMDSHNGQIPGNIQGGKIPGAKTQHTQIPGKNMQGGGSH